MGATAAFYACATTGRQIVSAGIWHVTGINDIVFVTDRCILTEKYPGT